MSIDFHVKYPIFLSDFNILLTVQLNIFIH